MPGRRCRAATIVCNYAALAAVFLLTALPASPAALGQELAQLPDVVDRVSAAVVSIRVESTQTAAPQSSQQSKAGDAAAPTDQKAETAKPVITQGTGMVLSADGYIVTVESVLTNARTITVTLANGTQLSAELSARDPRTSIALLKIAPASTLAPVSFADSERVRRGQQVFAVGNPFGLGGSVSLGLISALGRDIGFGPYDLFQTDAVTAPGDAGGPIFNLKGEVVGMATHTRSASGAPTGIGFALPSNLVKDVAEKLRRSGAVERGWLGVQIRAPTDAEAASRGVNQASGVMVSSIVPGGPAASSGLAAGDAIVALDGRPVNNMRAFARAVADYAPNTELVLSIAGATGRKEVRVRLGRFPGAPVAAPSASQASPSSAQECTRYLPNAGMTISVPCGE